MNLLDWLLVVAGAGLRAVGLLAGLRHRRVRHRGPAARRPARRLAGADRARRRRPVAAGLARRAVHRDPLRLARAGGVPVRRRPAPRPDHLAAGPRASTPSAAPCSARSPCCSSPGRSASRSPARGLGGVTPLVRESGRPRRRSTRRCPTAPTACCSAFNNVVGTSFFPRYLEPFAPERIVEVGPGPQRLLTDPDVVRRRGQRASRSAAPTAAAAASRAPASSTPTTG